MQGLRVALVYDRVNKWGGAERVLLAMHKIFPKAPLYTSVYLPDNAPWAKNFKVKTSFLQKVPFVRNFHEFFAPFMPQAFEDFNFKDYDVVISVTSEAAKGIRVKKPTVHVCYCLTPTRYLWSGYDDYFKNRFLRILGRPFVKYLRTWDLLASKRPDFYIAISKEVQKRIKKFYKKDSKVIYPPVSLRAQVHSSQFTVHRKKNEEQTNKITNDSKGYFLVVSRLVPYKRIDLAIAAANKLKFPLKIVGEGSQFKKLKKMSGPTVKFLGSLTEEKLLSYYKNCKALIFPGNEDFGLAILEAQSLGKPVIAYARGGALETVIKGKTGLFFKNQKKEDLIEAIGKFETMRFKKSDCIKQARKFSDKRFKHQILETIDYLIKKR